MKMEKYLEIKKNAYENYEKFKAMTNQERLDFILNSKYINDSESLKIFITTLLVPCDIQFLEDLKKGNITELAAKYYTIRSIIIAKKWEFIKNKFAELIRTDELSKDEISEFSPINLNQFDIDDTDDLIRSIFEGSCNFTDKIDEEYKNNEKNAINKIYALTSK